MAMAMAMAMAMSIGWCSASASSSARMILISGPRQRRWSESERGRARVAWRCRCRGSGGGGGGGEQEVRERRTCKQCKAQFDPALNHASACTFHPAHFGGETKRKFESVYTGGTLNTPGAGQVFQYWHCCASDDPFHPGCTSAPHASYDD